MRDGVRAETLHGIRGRPEDPQFALGDLAPGGTGVAEGTRRTQLGGEQRHPLLFGERRVVVGDSGPGEEFAQHRLEALRVLSQIQATEVKPEGLRRGDEVA